MVWLKKNVLSFTNLPEGFIHLYIEADKTRTKPQTTNLRKQDSTQCSVIMMTQVPHSNSYL